MTSQRDTPGKIEAVAAVAARWRRDWERRVGIAKRDTRQA